MTIRKRGNRKRFVDTDAVKEKIAELHMRQIDILLERLAEGSIEPQEMRLIWDMVKAHGIGIESIEDRVEQALGSSTKLVDEIELDSEWEFSPEKALRDTVDE